MPFPSSHAYPPIPIGHLLPSLHRTIVRHSPRIHVHPSYTRFDGIRPIVHYQDGRVGIGHLAIEAARAGIWVVR